MTRPFENILKVGDTVNVCLVEADPGRFHLEEHFCAKGEVTEILPVEEGEILPTIWVKLNLETGCDWAVRHQPHQYLIIGDTPMKQCARETQLHVLSVANKISKFRDALRERAERHDQSKFGEVELPIFTTQTPLLKTLEYGSRAYHEALKTLGEALTHHYKHNDHHPEHHEKGVNGMDLLQIVEMFCDWWAASERMKEGTIQKSLDFNRSRFSLDDQLTAILQNTIDRYTK